MSTRCQIEFYDEYNVTTETFSECTARIYHHSDGYPSYIVPSLHWLEKLLSKPISNYGTRQTDTAWVAAEFVVQHRLRSDQKTPKHYTTQFAGGYRSHGCVYIDNQIHGDIEYLYRVICAEKWIIRVYRPEHNPNSKGFDIIGFTEITPDELKDLIKA
jgi:hypothetical protein